ncbi:MAG TPA: hypothetical protein VIL41_08105 [Coriobacteriia bacterium]
MDSQLETHSNRMNMDRIFALGFVIAGGLFWMTASFAALFNFVRAGAPVALLAAFYVFAATGATLAIGWFYERSAAALLVLGSAAVVVWGAMASWELGVWILMGIFLIGPMLTAAALFAMARREQIAVERALESSPQLAPAEATIPRI